MAKFIQKSLRDHKIRNLLIGLYILMILAFSASAKAETRTYEGEITQTADGSSYLVVSDREYYEVVSNEINFDEFSGSFVQLTAEVVKLTAGPVFTTQFSEVSDSGVEANVPVGNTMLLHVLGISAITE